MSEDFASHTGIKWQGNVGTVEYGGGDKSMIALFYLKPIQNPQKSLEAGRPIFEDVVYVRIHPPGERLNIVDRPASALDKSRWPLQWIQFSENRKQTPEGTPVDLLYPDQPSVPAMLRANNVFTIEQLAELSGNAIENVGMGAQKYVNEAKKYLETANKGVGAAQMRSELDKRDSEIRALKNEIKKMQEMMEKKEATPNIDPAMLQAILAGMSGRPQFPLNHQVAPVFDAQAAQINATHVTGDIAKTKRRQRARLKE